ncbi:MAG: hypothetical protein AB7S71_11710 [Dongiaceae bacterium]
MATVPARSIWQLLRERTFTILPVAGREDGSAINGGNANKDVEG